MDKFPAAALKKRFEIVHTLTSRRQKARSSSFDRLCLRLCCSSRSQVSVEKNIQAVISTACVFGDDLLQLLSETIRRGPMSSWPVVLMKRIAELQSHENEWLSAHWMNLRSFCLRRLEVLSGSDHQIREFSRAISHTPHHPSQHPSSL